MVSSAATGLIAGANLGSPEVRITMGLPSTPCSTNFTYVPPVGEATNTTSTNTESGFCLANVEAKVESGKPVFTIPQTPTANVSRTEAAASCSALPVANGVGKLPTNTQWQVLANIAFWTKENWRLGYPGYPVTAANNFLISGVNASVAPSGLAGTSSSDECAGTNSSGNCFGSVPGRRTHFMGNTTTKVWDLGGNLSEWISDGGLSAGAYGDGWIASMSKSAALYYPVMATSDLQVWAANYHFGLGLASASSVPANAGILRGGSFSDTSADAGVFRADFNYAVSQNPSTAGFRCVNEIAPTGF